jgi:ferredoxin
MTMVVTEPCVGCKHKDCVAVCPCDSFHEGETMLYVNPQSCIDCDACISECPVEAIFAEANVPDRWHHYIALNAEGARRHPVATP